MAGSTKPRLLRVAIEVAGGTRALAQRIGISEAMLERYISESFSIPDALMLRVVDVILDERENNGAELVPQPRAEAADPRADA
jgi:hypothetical protein